MKTIILRRPVPANFDFQPVGAYEPGSLSLEVEDLSAEDEADILRDPTVLDHAHQFPLQLIAPLAAPLASGTTATPPPVSWGISAVKADRTEFTGAGVTVAVLDTGIVRTHPAFAHLPGDKLIEENFTSEPVGDLNGHGTHCAGTIFGQKVGDCRIGVAPGIEKALIAKVIGAGGNTSDAIFRALLWAAQHGAHVISMSLGLDFVRRRTELATTMPEPAATSTALSEYAANLRLFDNLSQAISARGLAVPGVAVPSVVVAAAAGNQSNRPHYRIAAGPLATASQFLSVAALKRLDGNEAAPYAVADFSNTGARLAAPGVDIWSAGKDGGLALSSGTSMATPHVAGVAALWAGKLLQRERPLSAARVIDEMQRATVEIPGCRPTDVGMGLVQSP